MEDTTTPVTTQADVTTESTSTQAVTNTPEAQAATGQQENISLDEAKKLRSEAANLRKRLKAFEDAEQAAKEAALSDVEKSNKRASEAEAKVKQYQQQLVQAQVKMAAQAKGIIDPDLAALALASSLEYDDEGMPTNLDKALDTLIKNKPYLAPAKQPEQQQTQEQLATPAQTAQTQRAPQVPAMNPGRASIAQPGTVPQGTPLSLSQIQWKRR